MCRLYPLVGHSTFMKVSWKAVEHVAKEHCQHEDPHSTGLLIRFQTSFLLHLAQLDLLANLTPFAWHTARVRRGRAHGAQGTEDISALQGHPIDLAYCYKFAWT